MNKIVMPNNISNRKHLAKTEKEMNGFKGPKSLIEIVIFKSVYINPSENLLNHFEDSS